MQENVGSAPRQDSKRSAAPRLVGSAHHGREKVGVSPADYEPVIASSADRHSAVSNLGILVPSDTDDYAEDRG
jgi:hypothetical protein